MSREQQECGFDYSYSVGKVAEERIAKAFGTAPTIGKCNWDGVASNGVKYEVKTCQITHRSKSFSFEIFTGNHNQPGDIFKSYADGVEILIINAKDGWFFIDLRRLIPFLEEMKALKRADPYASRPKKRFLPAGDRNFNGTNTLHLIPRGEIQAIAGLCRLRNLKAETIRKYREEMQEKGLPHI